jgi:hypothetical protein
LGWSTVRRLRAISHARRRSIAWRRFCALRRLHLTAAEIAEVFAMPLSTVSALLLREGLGKRSRLAPVEPANRYERRSPGELIHIDIKKLGRIVVPGHAVTGNRRQRADRTRIGSPTGRKLGTAGWEFVHVAIDDHSRLAYAEVLPDEKAASAVGFLRRALGFFARYGVRVERVLTDGCCFYVKSRVPVGVLQWIVTLRMRRLGVLVGMVVAGSG